MLEEYDDILSVFCLMEILGIGKNSALKLVQTGEIRAKKIGGKWRVLKDDLILYLNKN